MKCKECECRIPKSHQDEFHMHQCLCRKCWAKKESKWKDVKNTGKDLFNKEE